MKRNGIMYKIGLRLFVIKYGRLDSSFRYETLYKSITGRCLHGIDIDKLTIGKEGIIKLK